MKIFIFNNARKSRKKQFCFWKILKTNLALPWSFDTKLLGVGSIFQGYEANTGNISKVEYIYLLHALKNIIMAFLT